MSKAPVTARPHAFYIRPAPGWVDVLFDEVSSVVSSPLQKYKYEAKVTALKGAVKLHRCDWRQGLEVMLRLTTAHDVEWLILESKCNQWSEVESILSRVEWQDILPREGMAAHISADVFSGSTSTAADLRDTLCNIARVRHVSEGEEIRFRIDLRSDFLRLSASLCGEPLYKRGYKTSFGAVAPLPEHHAAACIRWVLKQPVDDGLPASVFVPFAGSGTFGFEAALVLSQSGPGAFPRSYACELFPVTPAPTMGFLRRKLSERFKSGPCPQIFFNDFNEEALDILKENVKAFPHSQSIKVWEGDVFTLKPVFPSGKILVLLNPPYGNRLAKESSMPDLYGRIGKYMYDLSKRAPNQILGGCICPDEPTWRSFRKELRNEAAETHHFTHGGKEMRFVKFSSRPT